MLVLAPRRLRHGLSVKDPRPSLTRPIDPRPPEHRHVRRVSAITFVNLPVDGAAADRTLTATSADLSSM